MDEKANNLKGLRQRASSEIDIQLPSIDRKLKPSIPQVNKSKSLNVFICNNIIWPKKSFDSVFLENHDTNALPRNNKNAPMAPVTSNAPVNQKKIGHLEYLELNDSNQLPIFHNVSSITNRSIFNRPLPLPPHSSKPTEDIFHKITSAEPNGIVYRSVDFIKTEAIKRTRQHRAQDLLG